MWAPIQAYNATIFVGWQDRKSVTAYQQFRKQLFIDKLGWSLHQSDGFEFDEFDTGRAVYCVLRHEDSVVGGWRAIRTTEDYLSHKIFPDLAELRGYPSRPDIWEISRLGVSPQHSGPWAARAIYALMVHFSLTRNLRSLIGVVDVVHARKMSIAGLKVRRFGKPSQVGVNRAGEPIVAFLAELRPAEQAGFRYEKLMQLLVEMEIRDEALLLGPESVSA